MQRNMKVVGFWRGALGACVVVSVACGGGSGAPAASPESGANGASEGAPMAPSDAPASDGAATEAPAGKDATPAAAGDSSKPAPAQQSLLALCEEGCKKIKARCTETAYENCKMNCAQYDHPPPGCEAEARQALECARDAEDTPCVNIAPEICTHKFQRVVACMGGKTIEAKEDAPRTPDGWERFSAKSAGFSVMAPKGMAQNGELWSVKANDVDYLVKIFPAPKEKPTQKNLVQVAMGVLGKCSQKLKLRGMVDRPDKVFIRVDSACPDGTVWNGAFLITGGKMYMPYVATPKGTKTKPEIDAFVYGFEAGGK
jgi:hypothetical protein